MKAKSRQSNIVFMRQVLISGDYANWGQGRKSLQDG